MDIKAHQADAFVRAIPANVTAALFYGPDAGLVSERGEASGEGLGGRSENAAARSSG